jgi:hypothetical protein
MRQSVVDVAAYGVQPIFSYFMVAAYGCPHVGPHKVPLRLLLQQGLAPGLVSAVDESLFDALD